MLLFSELVDALIKWGPTIENIIKALIRGKVTPSDLEKEIERIETSLVRAEIERENPDA